MAGDTGVQAGQANAAFSCPGVSVSILAKRTKQSLRNSEGEI